MTRRTRLALVLVAGLLLGGAMAACEEPVDCTGTGAVAHRDLRYASSPGTSAALQSLDLYTPVRRAGCAAAPLVVWVHGGAFVTGDKSNGITRKVDLFTKQGWAVASLNYRLVDHPGAGPTAGRYPAPEQDVASALAFLRRSAPTYGLDAGRLALLGHSAGAFLVSLDSTDGRFLSGAGLALQDVDCTASLDTTYDIPAQIAGGGDSEAMFRNAFGDDPAVWVAGSPMHNVSSGKGIPDFLVVTRGLPARVAQSEEFAARLRAAWVPARVVRATGLTHEQVNTSVGAPGDTVVTPPLLEFLRGCIGR
ncbi:MAG TPA: alpha/beta hydrolase [Acidimicrobiales bacterium]|nr:alpha/beta hydrolase [Acidimicrobiales bacterium]